jgi:hypothetical protein
VFVCGRCKESSKPGERARRLTLEARAKTYKDDGGNEAGSGFEIVKEVLACTLCVTGSPFVSKVAS